MIKKRICSMFLAFAMLFSLSLTAFAASDNALPLVTTQDLNASNTFTDGVPTGSSLDDFAIEVSLDDLQTGVTVALEDQGDKGYVARQLSPEESFAFENGRASVQVVATFHCGLNYNKNNHKGSLHWSATGNQLTRVQASIFCKDTSFLFPDYFFSGDIDGYSDLSGRYNEAHGTTHSFNIPSNVTKVKVGWSSAYVTTVVDGKKSMASASQTLTLADLPQSNVY